MTASRPLNIRTTVVLLQIIAIVAILHFADDVLVPIALALMLAFLLAPMVHRLERWGLPRPFAVALTTLVAFAVLAGVTYVVAEQFRGLVSDLPSHRTNLNARVRALNAGSASGGLERGVQTVQELTAELDKAATGKPVQAKVNKVEVVEPQPTARQLVRSWFATLIGPISTAGIVIVFVIFMLLQREDLRDRLVRLLGAEQMPAAVATLNDAARRVSRYLVMQTLINAVHGAVVALGLYLIGVPEPWLWGTLTLVLRFIPYLGPLLAAVGPIVLSLAVFPGWNEPLLVVGLIVTIELISNNLLEPRLYGSTTGVSSFALIVATVFWTWLWGAAGLLLATPLTVCLVVMGKHIPQFSYLGTLLGDQPVLAPRERFYQRLLGGDTDDAQDMIDEALEKEPLPAVLDAIVMPALRLAEQDHERGAIDAERRATLIEVVGELLEALPPPAASEVPATLRPRLSVIFLPAADATDELAARMLARTLAPEHYEVEVLSRTSLKGEMLERVSQMQPDAIVVSAMPPGALLHARYLCHKLRGLAVDASIIVGLWDAQGDLGKATARLSASCANTVVSSVAAALEALAELRQLRAQGVTQANHSTAPAAGADSLEPLAAPQTG